MRKHQHELIDIYRPCHKQQHIYSSQAHMEHSSSQITFWAIKNILNLKEQKSYKIKLEISNIKITEKSPNIWRLNNTLLNNTRVK